MKKNYSCLTVFKKVTKLKGNEIYVGPGVMEIYLVVLFVEKGEIITPLAKVTNAKNIIIYSTFLCSDYLFSVFISVFNIFVVLQIPEYYFTLHVERNAVNHS